MGLEDWDARVGAAWADGGLSDAARIAAIDDLARERPEGDPRAAFERAGARDAAGEEAAAEPLYRVALAGDLEPALRAQATIQLASTLRNLGRVRESLDLLEAERGAPHDASLGDALAAFHALALSSAGREREALRVALEALAGHLPRYGRSVRAYAHELVDAPSGMPTANTT